MRYEKILILYSSDTSNRDFEYKRQKLTDHTDRIQQLRSEANDLLTRKLQIDKNLQQRQKLEENKVQLQTEHEDLLRDMKVRAFLYYSVCIVFEISFCELSYHLLCYCSCLFKERQKRLRPKQEQIAELTRKKEELTSRKEEEQERTRNQYSKIKDYYKEVKTIQRHIIGFVLFCYFF